MSNAMGIRTPAALGVYGGNQIEQLVQASDDLMFTHSNFEALAGGEYFTRLTHKIVNSQDIISVDNLMFKMQRTIDDMSGDRKSFCLNQLQKGI